MTKTTLTVTRALGKLGADMRDAHRRRRIPTQVMADRASISRPTLAKVERGDPSVSMGTYATVLSILGVGDRLGEVAEATSDSVGLALEEERLPERIHLKRTGPSARSAGKEKGA